MCNYTHLFFVLTDFFYLLEKRFSVMQENWEILLKLFFLYYDVSGILNV